MENKFFEKKLFFSFRLLVILMLGLSISLATSCKKDDDDDDDDDRNTPSTVIPSDDLATDPPVVLNNSLSSIIPNPVVEADPNNPDRIKLSFTGIKDPATGNFIEMKGTGDPNQTCWLQVDGVNKGILVTKGTSRQKAVLADVVFVVDNSGSMSEEADTIAAQITSFVSLLESSNIDLRVGIVGYDSYVNGGLDLSTGTELNNYLNRTDEYGYPITGTYRTYGFTGTNAENWANIGYDSFYAGGENGITGIYFADQYFNWRQGSQRVYVTFTDEGIQPNGSTEFSVEGFEASWTPQQGTVHSIFSIDDYYWEGEVPDTSMDHYNGYAWGEYYQRPWELATFTGGSSQYIHSDCHDLDLTQIEVTGALTEIFLVEFMNNEGTGAHTLRFVVKNTGSDSDGEKVLENISY